jgi:cysteine-rich repeat protein
MYDDAWVMRESVSSLRGSLAPGCALSLVLAGAGCAQILGLGEVDVVDQPVDCPPAPPDTVIACANITHVRADGTTFASRKDLSAFTVAAYVSDPGSGGFRIVSGTAGKDGVARIEGVPDGAPYYFRIQNPLDPIYPWPHYFYTDKHTLEIGHAQIGRDDTPATSDTQITVNMTGMTPWKPRDLVGLASFETGTDVFLTFGTDVPVGATTVSVTRDWRTGLGESTFADLTDAAARPAQLIDQARGDDLWALHQTSRIADSDGRHPVEITTVVDAVNLTGVTMANGKPLSIGGAFQPAAAVATPLTFVFNAGLFRNAFRDDRRYYDETVSCTLNATPAASRGLMMGGASLVVFSANGIPGSDPGMRFTVPYTNPFPTTWAQLMRCSIGHTRQAKVPGTTRTSFGFSYITSYTPVASDTVMLAPPVHSVTNLKVGGADGLVGGRVPFDGTTPVTISWDPVAGVTHYQIRVKDETTGQFLGVFDSTQSSIVIPADTFIKGNYYVFRVFAIQTSGEYVGGKLLDFVAPLWSARISTGMFRFSSSCGNGTVDMNEKEECDSGAVGNTMGCDADCSIAVCGDGFHNLAAQEQCDDTVESPQCGTNCRLPVCGDGTRNRLAGEECDEMNTTNGDGCSSLCKLESCGNRTINAPHELCDDGNRFNGDGCDAFCQPEPTFEPGP